MSDCPVCARAARLHRRVALRRHMARIIAPFLKPSLPGFPGGSMSNAEIEEFDRGWPGKSEPVTDEA